VSPLLLAAAEPSKTAFFIAGGAVVLAAIGLNRPNFPFGNAGGRAVMLLSLALAVVAIAMAIVTA
jgi:hypothetical protein